MSETDNSAHIGAVPNDDGTHSIHYMSLDVGYARIEHLSIIEMYNLLRELDEHDDDQEAVLVKWAQGYRDANMYELADCGDDWLHVLAGDMQSRWGTPE